MRSTSQIGNRTVLTYGTFDLFHVGHLRLLQSLRAYGDSLIVGVSSDEFNTVKGKKTVVRFEDRAEIVAALDCVDLVIKEDSWEQKVTDIENHGVSVFGIGDDWAGKFDHLRSHCEVVYLPRTDNVSSTEMKRLLHILDRQHVRDLQQALELISTIVERFR